MRGIVYHFNSRHADDDGTVDRRVVGNSSGADSIRTGLAVGEQLTYCSCLLTSLMN